MEFIDDMVIDGLFNSIECSLRFFLDNTGKVLLMKSTVSSKIENSDSSVVSFIYPTVVSTAAKV